MTTTSDPRERHRPRAHELAKHRGGCFSDMHHGATCDALCDFAAEVEAGTWRAATKVAGERAWRWAGENGLEAIHRRLEAGEIHDIIEAYGREVRARTAEVKK